MAFLFFLQSFYLPGSVDMHNKQMEDWNLKAPPLYLWSRRDWSVGHKEIARAHGHAFQEELHVEENNIDNYLMEENNDCFQDYASLYASGDLSSILDDVLDYNDEAEPEGAGASDGVHIGRQDSLNEIECEGGGPTELIAGNWNGFVPSNMCINMELSSPTHSLSRFKSLHEVFGTPEMEDAVMGWQVGTASGYIPNMATDLENGAIQTGYPTVTGRMHSFQAGTNFGYNYF